MAGDATGIVAVVTLVVTLVPGASFHVRGRDIHLSDIALVAPTQSGNLDPIIARLPVGQRRVRLTRAQLADLIARAMPGAQVTGETHEAVTIWSENNTPDAVSSCFRLAVRKSAGQLVSREDTEPATCEAGKQTAAIRYERDTGTVEASEDLEAGAYLGHVSLAAAPAVRRGQKIVIGGAVGPVQVQRTVVALQSVTASGQRLFVRDGDGEVFAAKLSASSHR